MKDTSRIISINLKGLAVLVSVWVLVSEAMNTELDNNAGWAGA